MNRLSVIIPSKTVSNLILCSDAVRKHEPNARVLAVWDACGGAMIPFHCCATVVVHEPFIYARNCNIGVRAAEVDDVLLLNDDALLQSPGGFTLLQQAAREHPEYGIIAATCNNVGNTNQWPKGIGLREDPRMVCFVAVLIPRRTIETVGMLDERFTGYGCDDDDYCLRVRKAGLKIGIHDGCYVDHGSLKSTFRGGAAFGGDFRGNLEIFKRKWGMDNWGRPA